MVDRPFHYTNKNTTDSTVGVISCLFKRFLIVASHGPVAVHFFGEDGVEFTHQPGLEHPVSIDLALDLFVLGHGFFHAVLGVELRVPPAVDVVKNFQGDLKESCLSFRHDVIGLSSKGTMDLKQK